VTGSPPMFRALVVGGSVAGLAAALELRRVAGAEVVVYERSAGRMRARGAGVVMQPEVEELLRVHGPDPASICVPLVERQILRGDGAVQRTEMPQQMTAWDALYRALRAPLADACYRQDSPVVAIDQAAQGVEVAFADGHSARGHVVVGADGVHSVCRTALTGQADPATYAGYVAWRGLENETSLPEDVVAQLAGRF